jgi:hypothetical protein
MRCMHFSPLMIVLIGTACAKTPPAPPSPSIVHDTVFVRETARVDTVVDPDTRQRLTQMEAEVL